METHSRARLPSFFSGREKRSSIWAKKNSGVLVSKHIRVALSPRHRYVCESTASRLAISQFVCTLEKKTDICSTPSKVTFIKEIAREWESLAEQSSPRGFLLTTMAKPLRKCSTGEPTCRPWSGKDRPWIAWREDLSRQTPLTCLSQWASMGTNQCQCPG